MIIRNNFVEAALNNAKDAYRTGDYDDAFFLLKS